MDTLGPARDRFDRQAVDWDLTDSGVEFAPQKQSTITEPVSVTGPGTFFGKETRTLKFEPTDLLGLVVPQKSRSKAPEGRGQGRARSARGWGRAGPRGEAPEPAGRGRGRRGRGAVSLEKQLFDSTSSESGLSLEKGHSDDDVDRKVQSDGGSRGGARLNQKRFAWLGVPEKKLCFWSEVVVEFGPRAWV